MHNVHKKLAVPALILTLAIISPAFAASPSQDAPIKDPPQWHTEDITPEARYRTARKEAGAAYEEARRECRSLTGAERSSCLKEAQATFVQEMAEAKKELQR